MRQKISAEISVNIDLFYWSNIFYFALFYKYFIDNIISKRSKLLKIYFLFNKNGINSKLLKKPQDGFNLFNMSLS